jgi:hypothetical protein
MSKEQIIALGDAHPYFYKDHDFVEVWFAQKYLERLGKYNESE